MITRWVVGVVLLFAILLSMLPKTDKQSVARMASASMLMCTLEFRERVGRQVIRGRTVSEEFRNTCPDLIATLTVDDQGNMVITGNKHALKMNLTPVITGDKIRWSCHGEPAAAIAKLCRP